MTTLAFLSVERRRDTSLGVREGHNRTPKRVRDPNGKEALTERTALTGVREGWRGPLAGRRGAPLQQGGAGTMSVTRMRLIPNLGVTRTLRRRSVRWKGVQIRLEGDGRGEPRAGCTHVNGHVGTRERRVRPPKRGRAPNGASRN